MARRARIGDAFIRLSTTFNRDVLDAELADYSGAMGGISQDGT
jgi:hypothetical protein